MAKRSVELDIQVNGTSQITDTSNALEQTSINAEKVADSTLKLTKGIAGGFELAAQAASVFGEETGKAFEETVQRATQYIALSNALKDVAEGFSSENIKGLTGIFKGFTKAGIGAKLFGTTTAAAITATGIGALVVALGLVAANWETVVKWVKDFANSIPFLKSILETVENLGGVLNIVKASFAAIVGLFKSGTSAAEEFDKAIAQGKAEEALNKQTEALEGVNEERERAIKILEAEGNKEKEVFAIKKKIQEDTIKNLEDRKKLVGELTKEEQKQLADAITNLRVLEAQEAKFEQKKREEQAKTSKERSDQRKKDLDDEKKALDEKAAYSKAFDNEIESRKIGLINDERKRKLAQLKFETDNEAEKRTQEFIADKISEQQYYSFKEILAKEYIQKEDAINEEARKKRVSLTLESEKAFIDQRFDAFKKSLTDINDISYKTFFDINTGNDITMFDRLAQDADRLLSFINKLERAELSPEGYFEATKYTNELIDYLEQVNQELVKSGFNLALTNEGLKKVKLSGEDLLDINFENFLDQKRLDVSYDLALKSEREFLKEGRKQRRKDNDEYLQEYREYLRELREATGESRLGIEQETRESLDAIFAYVQEAGKVANDLFNYFNEQDAIAAEKKRAAFDAELLLYNDAVNEQKELNEQLKTAEGARYQEILNSIDKAKAKEKSAYDQALKLKNEEIKINNRIAKQKWEQAVVQSAILTAGAVLNALNTVPPASFAFAAVTAALAAVQTGIVIASKPKDQAPVTALAAGGYSGDGVAPADATGERPVNAQLHEKEWVAPRWMVESDRYGSLINQLEGARKTGFAQGGFTTTPVIADNVGNGAETLMAALQGLNLQVAVTEINSVQNRVAVIEEKASL